LTQNVGIVGWGKFLPPNVVSNFDLVSMGIDTSDEWIVERTGIKSRRIAPADMSTSDMAFEAAKIALERSGKATSEIDLVIVATTSPDYIGFPSTASILQNRLGLRTVGAFDLSAACSGFGYALATGTQFVQNRTCRNVLVVGADSLSKLVNWSDRGSCILFGDGAGAVVLSATQEPGVIASDLHADGSEGSILMIKGGGTRKPLSDQVVADKEHLIFMEGRSVFKVAVNTVVNSLLETLGKIGKVPDDIDQLVLHQANSRIIQYVGEKLGLPDSKVFSNIATYGNTSAASIPIAIDEAVECGRIRPGDLVATIGFGAGFTWATNIIRWGV